MEPANTSYFQEHWQHVVDANGVSLALTGLLIVFSALVIISLYITVLPRLLAALHNVLPEPEKLQAQDAGKPKVAPTPAADDDLPRQAAAAALAVHHHLKGKG